MQLKSYLQYIVTLTLLSITISVFADAPAPSLIQAQEKSFDYNWNNPAALPPTKAQVKKIENFLKTLPAHTTLTKTERPILGKLLYKLATYYSYAAHKPDQAIIKLTQVDNLLTTRDNKAWTYNQLAYAYEQKFSVSHDTADKKKALAYTDKVINHLYDNQQNKEVAFAYSVKALAQNDAKDYTRAEANYKKSLKIYASLPTGKDEQYERNTTTLAGIILNQPGREKEALALLDQVKHYWMAKGHLSENPNAAVNYISLGQAYLKVGDMEAAHLELSSAMNIYKNVYGNNTALLAKPYKLLAQAYKKQGDHKLALLYQTKALTVERA
jgi:tetratricopeptide (TPR) repeat protein